MFSKMAVFGSMEGASFVHSFGPENSGGENIKLFLRSPVEAGGRDGLYKGG